MEVKVEIKKDFDEHDQKYMEAPLTTSIDLENLKNEPEEELVAPCTSYKEVYVITSRAGKKRSAGCVK
ncbi:unnamed protein product [Diabrotica balteata]|uniref:Uncharacterized protein n=1 Tax=Diabrotica balteata TaxID=107213 RepID=A0A9N9SN65_DIABA|nr:unnamed protein product [Diabrotica balteata]